jgi:hypothetical protein
MSQVAGLCSANSSNRPYPVEESIIIRQLVRKIGAAQTWQDMVDASNALFQVELRAKQMREERDREGATQRQAVIGGLQGANQANRSWMG